jgi:hypothetical protein
VRLAAKIVKPTCSRALVAAESCMTLTLHSLPLHKHPVDSLYLACPPVQAPAGVSHHFIGSPTEHSLVRLVATSPLDCRGAASCSSCPSPPQRSRRALPLAAASRFGWYCLPQRPRHGPTQAPSSYSGAPPGRLERPTHGLGNRRSIL